MDDVIGQNARMGHDGMEKKVKEARECMVKVYAMTRLKAKWFWQEWIKPIGKVVGQKGAMYAASAKVEVVRRVKKSRKNGLLKRKRNRQIVALLVMILLLGLLWYLVKFISFLLSWVLWIFSFGGINSSTTLVTNSNPVQNDQGSGFLFSEEQLKARVEARVKAAVNSRLEEEKEKRIREEQFSKEFEKFEETKRSEKGDKVVSTRPRNNENEKQKRQKIVENLKEKRDSTIGKWRNSRSFMVIDEALASASVANRIRKRDHKSKETSSPPVQSSGPVLENALAQLGYKSSHVSEGAEFAQSGLMWVIAPQLECESLAFKSVLNSIADLSSIITFCHGDSQWVGHLGRKDVLVQRLQWFDVKMHRFNDCPLYSDFVIPSYIVNPSTDLQALEEQLRSNEAAVGTFIVKHQKPLSELAPLGLGSGASSLPLVTTNPIKTIKMVRKRGHDMEGLVVQPFKSNLLLWEGRRFTIQTWAFVASSNPLIILYHDGVIRRSIDRYGSTFAKGSLSKQQRKAAKQQDSNYFANITSRQEDHPFFSSKKSDAFSCMENFQSYLSKMYKNGEMSHYTDLILRPYLKRLMLFAIQSLRREHRHEVSTWAMQQICFDFIIDSNWNVWMLDVSPQCSVQIGGADFSSPCKRAALDALGTQTVQIAEQLFAAKSQGQLGTKWLEGIDIGSFEVLFDETNPDRSKVEAEVCKRSAYQGFRSRQTFSKRVVQAVLPFDGRPKFHTDVELGMDRSQSLGPWACPVCRYENSAKAKSCDRCGSSEHDSNSHPTDFSHEEVKDLHSVRPAKGNDEIDIAGSSSVSQGIASRGNEFDAFFDSRPSPTENHAQHVEVAAKAEICAGKKFAITESVELVGHDIEPLRTATYHACCSSCAINPSCRGFSYVAETYQCWIKAEVGSQGHHDGTVSGILEVKSSNNNIQHSHSGRHGQSFDGRVHQSSESARHEFYKQRLISIFQKHDPNKLAKVDSLLERYRGNEERFILRTERQYETINQIIQERNQRVQTRGGNSGRQSDRLFDAGTSPQQGVYRDSHGLTVHDYQERIREIFLQNDPTRVNEIETMLEHFKGKEMQLIEYLLAKYK